MGYYLSCAEYLSTEKMLLEYPGAKIVMKCLLSNYRLLFCLGLNGTYAAIEKYQGSSVPAVVWILEENAVDEIGKKNKDFIKKEISITSGRETIQAVMYAGKIGMLGYPEEEYLNGILDGYEEHGFDPATLEEALDLSAEVLKEKGE